jgi:acetate---CoA ligase (ADP-forming)
MPTIYTHAQLDPLLNPRSIAVVGASPRAGSFGQRTLQNLATYTGRIFPVNEKYGEIGGLTAYASLTALPEPPDCVVIAIPREGVVDAVKDCVRAKAGGAVIYTSGFSETGNPAHAQLQAEIARIARDSGMPVVGPNCLGLFNASCGLSATFAGAPKMTPPQGRHNVGLVSQSGAMGLSLMQAMERGMGFSHLLTAGNSCDVDVADMLAYLAADDACPVVACLFEGMAHPRKLLEAGRIARERGKPVLIYKFATGEDGAAAAMSHTGSLAGSNAAYDALFEEAGFIRVQSLERMAEAAAFFAKARGPKGTGIGVLTGSGGAAILMADRAEHHGAPMPQLEAAGQAILDEVVPEFGAARNPCDLTAQALNNPQSFPRAAGAFLGDPGIGALVVTHSTAGVGHERMPLLASLGREHGKPVCIVWLSEWLEGPAAADIERDPHLMLFRSADRCVETIAQWTAWAQRSQQSAQPKPDSALTDAQAAAVRQVADSANRVLTESQSRAVLEPFGVPFVRQSRAATAQAALAAAREIGWPVVLKIESADIPHKTEAGGVRLSLRSDDQLLTAWEEIMARAKAAVPGARIDGALVQAMAPRGVEVMIGGRVDPLMGPLVTVGLGGVLVEILKDSATALCPVTPERALRMLGTLKGRALLEGYRGQPAVDLAQLASVVSAVSRFLHAAQGDVAELDINPLLCGPAGIVAVDALVVRPAAQ